MTMKSVIGDALTRVVVTMTSAAHKSYSNAESQLTAIGVVGTIGFPLYYFVWEHMFPQPYESMTLRLIGMVLMLGLLAHKKWPSRYRPLLPIYWYATILYTLSFFFAYMTLMNDTNMVWAASALASLFLMVLLLDWISVVTMFFIGNLFAWVAYYLSVDVVYVNDNYLELMPVFIFTMVAGSAFNHHTSMLARERREAMLSVVSYVAHELRTPLVSIKSRAVGIQRYLPALIAGYKSAVEHKLNVDSIRKPHFDALKTVLDDVDKEADYSMTIIDILLMNAREGLDKTQIHFEDCSMRDCVTEAMKRYPFKGENEKNKVCISVSRDFHFKGSKLLMVHVIFNLLKNAIYSISQKGCGSINVSINSTAMSNMLIVMDTGKGVPVDALPKVFNSFYTNKSSGQGSGMGLAFCKNIVENFGGKISVDSVMGEYAEFKVEFPAG